MTSQKTTNEKLNASSSVEFIEGKSPSEVADKLGIFLSAFEVHFGKETSKYGPLRNTDLFGIKKNSEDGGGVIIRERNKKQVSVKIDSSDIFSDIYKPSKILNGLEFKRNENGKYALGGFEVSTTNMDTLRDEMQRIAIILTQTCITRGELKDLSNICNIEASGEKGRRSIPQYELKHNPGMDTWFQNMLPEKFWKSKQLHFDRLISILRDGEGKKADPEEAAKYLEQLFEEALLRELTKK